MQQRILGRTGISVSAIGLGTEHLLNQPRADVVRVIHAAIERGVNYYDTFWPQPGFREDLGAAFQGHRKQVLLAAHLGSVMEGEQYAVSRDRALSERYLLEYLQRVGTDYVDVLFMHNNNDQADYDALFAAGGLFEQAQDYVQRGMARAIGLSGHNTATARLAVESDAIDVLMFPVNLTCRATPGYEELLAACRAHNVGLVAMKVFAGGRLLRGVNVTVEDYQRGRPESTGASATFAVERAITPAQCLAYVLDQRAVSTTVPGCRTVDELERVMRYWEASAPERDYVSLLPSFGQCPAGQCVYCNHCLPCAMELDIGAIMRLLDEAQTPPSAEQHAAYAALSGHASDRIACGDCEERCPFGVPVVERMECAVQLYE